MNKASRKAGKIRNVGSRRMQAKFVVKLLRRLPWWQDIEDLNSVTVNVYVLLRITAV